MGEVEIGLRHGFRLNVGFHNTGFSGSSGVLYHRLVTRLQPALFLFEKQLNYMKSQ